jgi:alpha-L-fucosidase
MTYAAQAGQPVRAGQAPTQHPQDSAPIRPGARQRAAAKTDPRLDWWRDARFGLFIHWGLYAIPAGEWNGERIPGLGEWIMNRAKIPVREYERLAQQFNPVKFNADEWVGLAKRAGQQYLTITAKHHDGFCLWDSKVTDYDVVDATPFKRDVLKELAAACAQQGIRLCFYYSQTQDWHHPGGDGNDWDPPAGHIPTDEEFDAYVREYAAAQVRELLTRYGPIGMIWFDTPRRMTQEQSRFLAGLVHQLQPACLVNGRIGNDVGDYASSRDNVIPEELVEMDWEVPATINDTWGFKHDDDHWKSEADLIRKLVDTASKNGNYLLNVGPTAEGVIPPPSVARLEAMGRWLAQNGESVYRTKAGPLQGLPWGRTTAQRNDPRILYLHVFEWPQGGTLRVPASAASPAAPAQVSLPRAWLLADRSPLPVSREGDAWIVKGPPTAPDPIDTVVVLEQMT